MNVVQTERLKKRLHVPLPAYADLPEDVKMKLKRSHKKRLNDMLSNVCKKILQGIMANKWSWPFNAPVDTNIYKDYGEKVKTPMDFGTIKKNLDGGVYTHPEQFVQHVRLVFDNARMYNKPGSDVHVMATTLQEKFEDRCASSITPRIVEEMKITDTEAVEARKRIADRDALKEREKGDGECAALIHSIDSLVSDIDIEKIKAASQCTPVDRKSKEILCEKLQNLREDQFSKVIGIVLHHYPGLEASREVAFDLEALDALCLRQMIDYMNHLEKIDSNGDKDTNAQWPPGVMLRSSKRRAPPAFFRGRKIE